MEIHCVRHSAVVIEEGSEESKHHLTSSYTHPTLPGWSEAVFLEPRSASENSPHSIQLLLIIKEDIEKKHIPGVQSQSSVRDLCGVNKMGGGMRDLELRGPEIRSPIFH